MAKRESNCSRKLGSSGIPTASGASTAMIAGVIEGGDSSEISLGVFRSKESQARKSFKVR